MILQALHEYYKRLEADPAAEVVPPGFSRQTITFRVNLLPDGTLHGIELVGEPDGKGPRGEPMTVPGQNKATGKGLNPCFLWDTTQYMLGVKANDPNPERTRQVFEAFREHHLEVEKEIDDPAFTAVCRFLERWKPAEAAQHEELARITSGFGVFRIAGTEGHVHERPKVRAWWLNRLRSSNGDGERMQCLVTGEVAPIARIHEPKIKGVYDPGGVAGKLLVSFELQSARSYAKDQSFNSPVSEEAAFRYAVALNKLLEPGSRQKVQLGDATTVFWTEKPTPAEAIFGFVFESRQAEDPQLKLRVGHALKSLAQGRYPGEDLGDPETPFYVLGLSPNAARLSVRFWWQSTLGEVAGRVGRHVAGLELAEWYSDERDGWIESSLRGELKGKKREQLQILRQIIDDRLRFQSEPLTVQDILDETVPAKNGRPDRERINPRLAGEVSRSILEGTALPRTLWSAVLNRVLVEGIADPDKRNDWRRARHRRMAILKACLNQFVRTNPSPEVAPVDAYLDKTHPNVAYHCGRLMAVLAFSQERALGKVNASVVRRYLSGVAAAPAATLGRLEIHAEVSHIPKLQGHLPSMVRDELKQINCAIGGRIPLRFAHGDQSYFVLGFYQEMVHLDVMRSSQRHRYRTTLGEWVRSKGELHIANSLAKAGVTYVYEPNAVLKSGQDRIPDFLIPSTSEEDNVYIEYVGMDAPEYTKRWHDKLSEYSQAGITAEGGPRGRLVVIDDPGSILDQAAIVSLLKQHRVIYSEQP